MKRNILKYLSVFGIYFVVDVTYQFSFGMKMSQSLQESAGIKSIFASDVQNPILILIWFALMTTAVVKLAVEPAVKEKSVKQAMIKGLILGVTAYGTLALANGWTILNYPLAMVLEVVFEGVLFAPIAAGLTTKWMIKS